MKQFEPSSTQPLGMPSHVTDAGKIVLGAGVRLPVLNAPGSGQSTAARESSPTAVANPTKV